MLDLILGRVCGVFFVIAVVLSIFCACLLFLYRKQKKENLGLSARCRAAEDNSVFDSLTNLYNYRFFLERLEQEKCRSVRLGRTLAILFIDLDGFKRVNQEYGRDRGDKILKRVAECLKKIVRSYDTAARFGKDEFILIMPEIPWEAMMRVAERLRNKIQELGATDAANPINLSAHVGIHQFDPFSASEEDQIEGIRQAISALYKNEKGGGIYVSPKMNRKIVW